MYYGMHTSTTAVHGRDCQKTEDRSSSWDCQNTAIVVGELAVELRPYIYPRNIIYNDFLGSATIVSVLFLFDRRARARTFAHSPLWLTPHAG